MEDGQLDDTDQIYARAISIDEYDMRIAEGSIRHDAEWVLCNGETSLSSYGNERFSTEDSPDAEVPPGTHSLWFLQTQWIDRPFRRHGGDVFEIIVAVRAKLGEFERNKNVAPGRYNNKCDIPFDRVKIIYDPNGVIHGSRIDLNLSDPMANGKPFERP